LIEDSRYIGAESHFQGSLPEWGSVMSTRRNRWPVFTAAIAFLTFSLASGVGHARDNDGYRGNGQHKGWYNYDKGDRNGRNDRRPGRRDKVKDHPPVWGYPDTPKDPVSVPEPGTLVLFIAGLAVVVAFSRKRT
jgi:hypothetical protein